MKPGFHKFRAAIIIILTNLLISSSLFAQSPEKMSYQAVIRDAANVLVTSTPVGMRISILQGSETGTEVYREIYNPNPKTNANGLVTIEIGSGIPLTGTFSLINWVKGPYFLKTETDPTGGTNYTITGVSELLSVPYALHAKTVAGYTETDPEFTVHPANSITGPYITNWNTAFVWGNHAAAGYVPGSRIITINGTALNLTANRSWNTGTVTSVASGAGMNFTTITGTGTISLGTPGTLTGTTTNTATGTTHTHAVTTQLPTSTTAGIMAHSGTKTAGGFYGGTTDPGNTNRTNYDGYLYATRFYGDGSNLGSLNAANITSGVLNIARIPTGTTGTTVSLGNHTHGNITSDGRIGTTANRVVITGTGGTLTTLSAGTTAQYLRGDGAWGTPVPAGTAIGQMQYWNGTAWLSVVPGTNGQVLTFNNGVPTWSTLLGAVTGNSTDIYSPLTGKVWMDRNLGASRVATSGTDAASYGHLYQWGRSTDGHQIRTSGTTTALSPSDTPGHGNFILGTYSPNDWRSPQNDNLWQGVNGVNNPCPGGYRLPTEAELNAERLSWISNDANGAFSSPLKLPMAGYRKIIDGSLLNVGTVGYYWSSTLVNAYSVYMYFSSGVSLHSSNRALGLSVRCLKD